MKSLKDLPDECNSTEVQEVSLRVDRLRRRRRPRDGDHVLGRDDQIGAHYAGLKHVRNM